MALRLKELDGTISEMLSLNSMASTIDQQIDVLNKDYGGIDALGGPKMENMYHSSWAYGGATPFQGTKLVAAYLGGTRTPLVISWPAKIKHDGKVRSQFHHVNDIAATIYDILDITPPKVVNGIEQQPLDGTSMVYTFDNPEAKTTKTTQYFEIIGSRGVYHEGWFAGTFGPRAPWSDDMAGILDWKPENDVWELYNLEKDYSQSKDLAKENPEKLAELKAVFDKEATENKVYPIGAGLYPMYYDTTAMPSFPLTEWSFYEGQTRIPEGMAPKFTSGRSTLAVIDAEIPKDAEGVLFVLGGTSSGFTVYMDKGVLHAEYNCMTLNRYKFSSKTPIPTGKVKIEVETKYDSKEREAPATLTMTVNGKQVAQGRIERSVPGSHTVSDTFDIGMDANSPVSLDYFDRAPFKLEIWQDMRIVDSDTDIKIYSRRTGRSAQAPSFTMTEIYRVRDMQIKAFGAVNTFSHIRGLADPEATRAGGVVSANNATVYSQAWLDLTLEPIVVDVPER
jgi:hypothetical protein